MVRGSIVPGKAPLVGLFFESPGRLARAAWVRTSRERLLRTQLLVSHLTPGPNSGLASLLHKNGAGCVDG